MTGTHAGAIDVDWLLSNIMIWEVDINASSDIDNPEYRPTFAFNQKAQQAAEDFLLSRHRLYNQVYLHKTTRGIEQLLKALFVRVAEIAGGENGGPISLGLTDQHPLIRFLAPEGGDIDDYLRLDDTVVWGAIDAISKAEDDYAKSVSLRLKNRGKLKVIDLSATCAGDTERLINLERTLEREFSDKIDRTVFKDSPLINLYGRIGDDRVREHKKVRVMSGGTPREITDIPGTVVSAELTRRSKVIRFYFFDHEDHERARKTIGG